MRVCCICKRGSSGSKTHVVPKNKKIAELWLKAVPELSETKNRQPSICQRHFKPEDYAGKKKIYLKPDVVPSIHLKNAGLNIKEDQPTPLCENSRHQRLLKRILQVRKANKALREECRKRRNILNKKDKCDGDRGGATAGDRLHLSKNIFGGCEGNEEAAATRVGGVKLMDTSLKIIACGKKTQQLDWTDDEIKKAQQLKSLMSRNCYDYISDHLMPLPDPMLMPDKCQHFLEDAATTSNETVVEEHHVQVINFVLLEQC